MCPSTGLCYRDPAPNNFSFNSPQGACPHCKGLGVVPSIDIENVDYQEMASYIHTLGIEEQKEWAQKWTDSIDKMVVCPECNGKRLNKEALHFRIDGKNISDVSDMELQSLYDWVTNVEEKMNTKQRAIAHEIIKEISTRLRFLLDVGLHYLSLSRSSVSLSGGESQRIRLATQIGTKLVNVLYILDEPSIGLHQRDNVRLIHSLKELRDEGNTVIVVEHDKDMMLNADYIVDMGPSAGRKGGEVVYQGTPTEMLKTDTLTSRFLNGKEEIEVPKVRRKGNGKVLSIVGAKGNNLKNVSVEIPLEMLVCVTGVSGSGKSTLINETLQPYLNQHFYHSKTEPLTFEKIEGVEHIDKIVSVDQSPLGRTPRSNPATYTDVFTEIRKLFVEMPESKMRAYKPGRFSFNVAGGRCETCGGNGYKTIQMNFLPDVLVPCETCHGKRYNRETLEVRFKGKSIADVLDMTINQAVDFFENQPKILQKIKVLQDVGLGYIKLGQPSSTLSGGESQRVKLATELAKKDTGKTLYILDEPTTGLHFEDIRTLMVVLNRLVDKGNSVIIIEHNLDVIKLADHIIDMGPEGGIQGGEVVVTGTPEAIALSNKGITAEFLKKEL
jgi:excinuclease ABC subunit A